jgi:hypothetical protein
LFVTSEGVQTDTGTTVPGKDVPTAQAVSQFTVADFSGVLMPPVTVDGYTMTITGNTIRITGPNTDYSVTVNSFNITNYQSCGACGVGSEVSFQLDVNVTEGGTFDGMVEPMTTTSGSGVLKWWVNEPASGKCPPTGGFCLEGGPVRPSGSAPITAAH